MWSIYVVRISNLCFSQAYTTSEISDSPVNTSHANCMSYCRSCLRQTFFKALLGFLSSTKLVRWTKMLTRLFSFTRCDEPMTMSMECVLMDSCTLQLGQRVLLITRQLPRRLNSLQMLPLVTITLKQTRILILIKLQCQV